jgi:hypothetical protein
LVHTPPLESPIQGEEYRRVLGAMAQEHVDGVIISDQPENATYGQLIVDLVRAAKLPTIFPPGQAHGTAHAGHHRSIVPVRRIFFCKSKTP